MADQDELFEVDHAVAMLTAMAKEYAEEGLLTVEVTPNELEGLLRKRSAQLSKFHTELAYDEEDPESAVLIIEARQNLTTAYSVMHGVLDKRIKTRIAAEKKKAAAKTAPKIGPRKRPGKNPGKKSEKKTPSRSRSRLKKTDASADTE